MVKHAKILSAVQSVLPKERAFGSPTLSDWAHLNHIAAVKIGPGLSEVSHTRNEWVDLQMVRDGAVAYEEIAREFLSAV